MNGRGGDDGGLKKMLALKPKLESKDESKME